LTRLAGDDVVPSAISESGVIVGSVGVPSPTSSPFDEDARRPAVWRTAAAQPELLGPDDLRGAAFGIDDDGTVIVASVPVGNQRVAPLTITRFAPDGTPATVALPDAADVFVGQVRAYDSGWLVVADDSRYPLVYYRWRLADGRIDQLAGYADGINRHGWVTVSLNPLPLPGADLSPVGTAYLRTPEGVQVDLPPPTGQFANYAISVYYVSDDGRTVAGTLRDPTYSSAAGDIAAVWHCA
jgi:hypothetical protein